TIWNRSNSREDATLALAVASEPGAARQLLSQIPHGGAERFSNEELRARLEQFEEESNILVPASGSAFEARDYSRLGEIVDRSQQLAESHLQNQVPETIALQRLARGHGALAASAFGGGFGGSVWALVRTEEAEQFLTEWA